MMLGTTIEERRAWFDGLKVGDDVRVWFGSDWSRTDAVQRVWARTTHTVTTGNRDGSGVQKVHRFGKRGPTDLEPYTNEDRKQDAEKHRRENIWRRASAASELVREKLLRSKRHGLDLPEEWVIELERVASSLVIPRGT